MIKSYDFYIAKKVLLSSESIYLNNALTELQTNGFKILDIHRKVREEYNYPESFDTVEYVIIADNNKDYDTSRNIRGSYFGRMCDLPSDWKAPERFDIVLVEKPGEIGLTIEEVEAIYNKLKEKEAYPIEIFAKEQESSAMGFITRNAADALDFNYEDSGLNAFIAEILDDMRNEKLTNTYRFSNLNIKLTRNIC